MKSDQRSRRGGMIAMSLSIATLLGGVAAAFQVYESLGGMEGRVNERIDQVSERVDDQVAKKLQDELRAVEEEFSRARASAMDVVREEIRKRTEQLVREELSNPEGDMRREIQEIIRETQRAEVERVAREQDRERKRIQAKTACHRYPMFLTKGLYAFKGYHNSSGGDDKFEYPMLPSLRDLTIAGVTTDFDVFRAAVLGRSLGYGKQFDQNDRGGFWAKPASVEDEEELKERFDEFSTLAPYFVEAKLLRE